MSNTLTEFRMRLDVVGKAGMVTGKWEYYPHLTALHRAVRAITAGGVFIDHSRSASRHYAQTGHARFVFRKANRGERSPRTHVIIHVIAR